jgi:hypothetical protein
MRIWPWSALRSRDSHIRSLQRVNNQLLTRIERGTAENRRLARERNEALKLVHGAPGSFQRFGAAKPEFVIVGLDAGPGMCDGVQVENRKRIMVSRELTGTTLGFTPLQDPPPRWKIDAVMAQMLTIDKPDYGQALDRMGEIWRNQDRNSQLAIEDAKYGQPSEETVRELTGYERREIEG